MHVRVCVRTRVYLYACACVYDLCIIVIPVLSIEKRNASSSSGMLIFSHSSGEYNTDVISNSIQIPESVIQERAKLYGKFVN